ncbi:alpha/beta fold hydrolase [Nonomuraea dietziae]|uniref:Pimeloyl-ACP methyl ester carboxylesterase n=1 Tax=Nonomuraea dietziae TaxID=65515 RepID=A0A7W5UZA2_9ACTN|nr:alpha/beta hydrolase [Nonomuraea dietziae]MBB3725774.1 pimeloyl-ACP methyl ester carboxylesterase [Nonomuraea dietziae]
MITAFSADGTEVRASDQGEGPIVLVLHAGLDDGSQWGEVAARLAPRFRVVRVHRRQYRLDLTPPSTIAQEVEDVLAVVAALGGGPVLLVGHSSGGVVALEAALASPAAFGGLVLYEPPVVVGTSLGGAATAAAQAAVARGRPGRALQIFLRDVVRLPPWQAGLIRLVLPFSPRLRALVPRQIDDLQAIDRSGRRLDAYGAVGAPTVLLGGGTSPAHLGERLDALAGVLPAAERVTLPGQGHGGHLRAPGQVARVIEEHALRVL